METSLKTGFAQIFSCCPKNLSCPNFGGGCSPPRPPGPYAYDGLAVKIKELTRETSRKIMRGGYVYKSKLKGGRSLCKAALFPQNNAFTKVNLPGLWD